MRVATICALFAVAFVASVAGHARLTATNGGGGIAWQPNPANGAGCGGSGTVSTTPYAVWSVGNTVSLYWQVVAGDGTGAITIKYDSGATSTVSNFVGSTTISGVNQNGNPTVGYHAFSFTVPAGFTCTGGTSGSLCHIQFKGGNNWVSCLTVSSDAAQAGNTAGSQPLCSTASGLSFCSHVVGSVFLNPQGTTIADMDASAAATHSAYLANRNVFSVGSADSTGKCASAAKDLICELTFGKCVSNSNSALNILAPCQSTCRAATCYCGLNKTHTFLYDCDQGINTLASPSNIGNPQCTRQSNPLPGLNGAAAVSTTMCAPGVNNPTSSYSGGGGGPNCLDTPTPPGCGALALLASPFVTAIAVVGALFAQKRLL
jgi:hypothetical protein